MGLFGFSAFPSALNAARLLSLFLYFRLHPLVPPSLFLLHSHFLYCLLLFYSPLYSFTLPTLFILSLCFPLSSLTCSFLLLLPLFFCKINSFPYFLLPSLHFSDCWCASCPSVLAVHLLCTWPCFCSCLFPPLLTIAKLLMSSPPIKAWAFPLPILLSLSPVSILGRLLPILVLGALGRWVWKDEEDVVFRSWASDHKKPTIRIDHFMWKKFKLNEPQITRMVIQQVNHQCR